MALAETIVQNCFAAILLSAALALALFLVSIPLICLEDLVQDFLLKRNKRKIPITGPITLKDGRKPNVADFLTLKVHMAEPRAMKPFGPDVCLDFEGRKSVIGLACPICSKDFGVIDEPAGVMVVPQCLHICHTKCFNKKFRHKNTCPSCNRAVEAKDIMEVKITSKPYNCQSKSSDEDV